MKRQTVIGLVCAVGMLFAAHRAGAQEIAIVFTGSTHAMLFPCNCPHEPDGGIARRASMIKDAKKKNPHTLVLDAGDFSAGGMGDSYTLNSELDMQRTRIAVAALGSMGYDAVAVGESEFNFGADYLKQMIDSVAVPFLSANLQLDKVAPFTVKTVGGVSVGIIGLTPAHAQQKSGAAKIGDMAVALRQAVDAVNKKGAAVRVLLAQVNQQTIDSLLKEVPAIDIVIGGVMGDASGTVAKKGATYILKPSWQGRRLSIAKVALKNGAVADVTTEELRASDAIADDPAIKAFLPRCFADANCQKEGLVGTCEGAGTMNARCVFTESSKVTMTVISDKSCVMCDTEPIIANYKKRFPALEVQKLWYPDEKAKSIVAEVKATGLPVYLFGKEVASEKNFEGIKEVVEDKGAWYMVKPQASGLTYFLNRKRQPGALDIFLSVFDKNATDLMDRAREFDARLHFLVVETNDGFDAMNGKAEVEEALRCACVQNYAPKQLPGYLTCRAKAIESSWWEDCLSPQDAQKVKNCARGEEGKNLLRENIRLNKELGIMFGPTYLMDNQEIFSSRGVPSKEELKKILHR